MSSHTICFTEVLLMSSHNIRFRAEIRKILCGYPLLSVAMNLSIFILKFDQASFTAC